MFYFFKKKSKKYPTWPLLRFSEKHAISKMDRRFYVRLTHWQSCVRLWHEILLGRRVDSMRVDAGEWVMTIPCPELWRLPTEGELNSLGMLIDQRNQWEGVHSLRGMECGKRKRKKKMALAKVMENLYSMGDHLFCIRGSDILLFECQNHMDLYLCIAMKGLVTDSFYGPLCSVLEVSKVPRNSEARLARYSCGEERLRSAEFWLDIVSIMWPGAESISFERWQEERHRGENSVEAMVHAVIESDMAFFHDNFPIFVTRDEMGRHRLCLFAVVRPSVWREASGSVLLVSYVAFHSRTAREEDFNNTLVM